MNFACNVLAKHAMCRLQTDVQSNFHIGEVVTSLQKSTLIPGGSESLVYTTLSGSIGILVPFASHEVSRQSFCLWQCMVITCISCSFVSCKETSGNYPFLMCNIFHQFFERETRFDLLILAK